MDTITIKTSHTVETEHEIQIPSYYISTCYAWKIVSAKKAIRVYFGYDKNERGVEVVSNTSPFNPYLESQPCTAEEFENIFLEAMVTLGEIAENGIVIEKQIETT